MTIFHVIDNTDAPAIGELIGTTSGTLRQMMLNASASAGDHEIVFDGSVFNSSSPQTITLAHGALAIEDFDDTHSGSVTIRKAKSTNPSVVIDAHRASRIINNRERQLIIDGIIFLNGQSPDVGGAIFSDRNRNLTIRNSTFEGNSSATHGGAVYLESPGTITVYASSFQNNTANTLATMPGNGGAIFVLQSSAESNILSTSFLNNSADGNGGAVYVHGGVVNFQSAQFDSNHADGDGGAVAFGQFNSTTVSSSVEGARFSGNSAANGGAISSTRNNLTVNRCEIAANTASLRGGGLFFRDGGDQNAIVTLKHSTFSGNIAPEGGGIAGVEPGVAGTTSLLGTNLTVVQNQAPAGTSAPVGNQIATFADGRPFPATITLRNSIVASDSATADVDDLNFLINTAHNLYKGAAQFEIDGAATGVTRLNEILDPVLRNNGGKSRTHALVKNGVAANAGDNSFIAILDTVDQRNTPFDRIVGGIADLGAYEIQPYPPEVIGFGDNDSDNIVKINTQVTYTIAFDTDVRRSTVSVSDFVNAGTAATHIDGISFSSNRIALLRVTPTSTGTLRMKIPAGATINSIEGNLPLVPPVPAPDVIQVKPNFVPSMSAQTFTTVTNRALNASFAAADANGDTLNFQQVNVPSTNALTVFPNGSFRFVPPIGESGVFRFTVRVSDGEATRDAMMTFQVDPEVSLFRDTDVDDRVRLSRPVVYNLRFATDMRPGTITPVDFSNSGTATIIVNSVQSIDVRTCVVTVTPTTTGTLRLQIPFGATLTSTGSRNLQVPLLSADTISVNPNSAPTAANLTFATDANQSLSGQLRATDIDGDSIVFSLTDNNPRLRIQPNGIFTYTPPTDFSGRETFTFRAADDVASTTATVTFAVRPVVRSISSNASGTLVRNLRPTSFTIRFLPDMAAATFQVSDFANAGTAAITVNSVARQDARTFVVTVTPSTVGTLQLKIPTGATLNSSTGMALAAPVTGTDVLTVYPNSAPAAANLAFSTNDETIVRGTLTASDADADPLVFTSGSPENPRFTVESDGTFSYTPRLLAAGAETLQWTASDGEATITRSITFNVTLMPIGSVSLEVRAGGWIFLGPSSQTDVRRFMTITQTGSAHYRFTSEKQILVHNLIPSDPHRPTVVIVDPRTVDISYSDRANLSMLTMHGWRMRDHYTLNNVTVDGDVAFREPDASTLQGPSGPDALFVNGGTIAGRLDVLTYDGADTFVANGSTFSGPLNVDLGTATQPIAEMDRMTLRGTTHAGAMSIVRVESVLFDGIACSISSQAGIVMTQVPNVLIQDSAINTTVLNITGLKKMRLLGTGRLGSPTFRTQLFVTGTAVPGPTPIEKGSAFDLFLHVNSVLTNAVIVNV